MNESNPLRTSDSNRPAAYWNPYIAGLLLGATLLASFLILGAGLGASAGPARLGAYLEQRVLPAHVADSDYFGQWVEDGTSLLSYYLVYMFGGAFLGGLISAVLARRIKTGVERGAAFGLRSRLALALGGGVLVGFASRMANGCTSGQALSGGAMLLNGSLAFMVCVFAGGYAAAWFVRRQWHD
ncbi:MAG: hypothetical protein FJ276_17245 [Planctomycetes bacterium]|nr:hypothetical protein [Planctomycetota bacterium]